MPHTPFSFNQGGDKQEWYYGNYSANINDLIDVIGKIFNATFEAIFRNGQTNLFEVLLVGMLFWFIAGLLLYMMRSSRK